MIGYHYIARHSHAHGVDCVVFHSIRRHYELPDTETVAKALEINFEPDKGEHLDIYYTDPVCLDDLVAWHKHSA